MNIRQHEEREGKRSGERRGGTAKTRGCRQGCVSPDVIGAESLGAARGPLRDLLLEVLRGLLDGRQVLLEARNIRLVTEGGTSTKGVLTQSNTRILPSPPPQQPGSTAPTGV